jgi:hypothetical protein
MAHFDIAEWTDYVRGLAPPSAKEIMARHLESGCESCARLVALIGRVLAERAAEPMVPEDLVRRAKAVFPERQSAAHAPDWNRLPRLLAQLVFTSLEQALPEGTRTGPESAVQAMFHAADYAIDLHVEREPESDEMALVGQVVSRAGGEPLGGVPVLLVARNKPVVRSQSNRFGEFCLVSRVQQGLKLCVLIEALGKRVEIPLTRIMAGHE